MVARNCKVVTTCFTGRQIRERTTMAGDPPGPFMHAQVFPDAESVLELLALVREFELKVDPGAECDTVIVNNDVGWERGNAYLASLDGTATFAGKLKVITRGNYGTSFGGNAFAYEHFGHQYEYWTFTEDDILITGHHYLARCIDMFARDPGLGLVALQGLSNDPALHAHGAVGTTRVDVLDAVRNLWGYLPHRRQHESQDDVDNIYYGEVLFTTLIERLGYRVVALQSDTPVYTFAFDYMRDTMGVRRKAPLNLLPRLLRRVARDFNALADRLE